MDKKNYKILCDWKFEEHEFHQYKSPISMNHIDVNKIVVSNKFPLGKQDFKYFIGYKDTKKIRPLCIFFTEMSICNRCFDKTKCTIFYDKIWKFFWQIYKNWGKS